MNHVPYWPPQAPYNEVADQMARQHWLHWRGGMKAMWFAVSSFDFVVTYRNTMIMLGGWFSWNVPALNDNEKQEVS